MAATHDKLLSDMHLWLWNEHPETRYLYHANFNNLQLILEKMLPVQLKIKLMSAMKSIGSVKGVLDAEFYWNGRLYGFDAKVGSDKLKKEQKEYIEALRAQGGDGCEIRSLEEFKGHIESIIANGKLNIG